MKNITTIERIAMQKTAMQKTAIAKIIAKITAKITTTALLFFLALFTLTTNLKAQAVQDNSKNLRWVCGFGWLSGRQHKKRLNLASYRVTGFHPKPLGSLPRIKLLFLQYHSYQAHLLHLF